MRVTRIEPPIVLVCQGSSCDHMPRRAEFLVTTAHSQHAYHRSCLPRKWRALVGLGTAL